MVLFGDNSQSDRLFRLLARQLTVSTAAFSSSSFESTEMSQSLSEFEVVIETFFLSRTAPPIDLLAVIVDRLRTASDIGLQQAESQQIIPLVM